MGLLQVIIDSRYYLKCRLYETHIVCLHTLHIASKPEMIPF